MTAAELRARLTRIAVTPHGPPGRDTADQQSDDQHGDDQHGDDDRGDDPHGDDPPGSVTDRLDRPALLPLAMAAPLVPAAVLVAVVLSDAPGILLTKRTSHLAKHAGQISFPGGRIDAADSGPEAAALREAWEEVGLEAGNVEVLGRMRNYATGTGYLITPVLGLLPPGLDFRLSPHEVDAVFELPMQVLLDPDAPRRQRQHVQGVWREYWVWPHSEHFIWGATAAILVDLALQLRGG